LKLETFNGEVVIIRSIKSGNWYDPTTWVGGKVPNVVSEDVVIVGGHTVELSSGYVNTSHSLTIENNATLNVTESLFLSAGSVLDVVGRVNMQNGAVFISFGYMVVQASGLFDGNGGDLQVRYSVRIDVYGWLTMNTGLTALVVNDGKVIVHVGGWIDVHGNSTYNVDGDGQVEVFGKFSIDDGSWLKVNSGGRVRIYGSLNNDGRIRNSGGRIDIMRREARINDYNGNPVIYFDQMYGHGQMQIG
jgi:hypothetical protein